MTRAGFSCAFCLSICTASGAQDPPLSTHDSIVQRYRALTDSMVRLVRVDQPTLIIALSTTGVDSASLSELVSSAAVAESLVRSSGDWTVPPACLRSVQQCVLVPSDASTLDHVHPRRSQQKTPVVSPASHARSTRRRAAVVPPRRATGAPGLGPVAKLLAGASPAARRQGRYTVFA